MRSYYFVTFDIETFFSIVYVFGTRKRVGLSIQTLHHRETVEMRRLIARTRIIKLI